MLDLVAGITELNSVGVELLLGKLFDEVGFNKINDPWFRLLVLSRIVYPVSKLKTTDYLFKYHSIDVDVQVIYRYLDKLHSNQKEQVQQISYEHTLKILDNAIQIVFYDVTTMYFEIDQEDDLRKTGFSKEGKHQNPQIVFGLLVSKNGYPLAYEIFAGNQYEGHTIMPVIEKFKEKFKVKKIIVVADSGLLSKENIQSLQDNGYEYILGARLKTMKAPIKESVLALSLSNGETAVIEHKEAQQKLIVSYSSSRARKDAYNRERGLIKLRKQIKTGKLTKQQLNNRGYNKFLEIREEVQIEIDEKKILQDKLWDGLKGYLTNSSQSVEDTLENYTHLWQIEKAFRIAKSDLKVRPIYHRIQRRIEAHICIVFAAYKIYKELERQLKQKGSLLSPEQAIDIASTIMSIHITHPITKDTVSKNLLLKKEQIDLAKLFDF